MRRALQIRSGSIVWLFHDVTDAGWFERCVDEITSGRDVLPLVELALDDGHEKACAITFDDGLRSVADVAHPILSARRLPYTVFVCTQVLTEGVVPWFYRVSHLGRSIGLEQVRSRWMDVTRRARTIDEFAISLKQVPLDAILNGLDELEDEHGIPPPDPLSLFLSADQVKALADAGATIGSHTHRHPILSLLAVEDQVFEVEHSAKVIESLTDRRPIEFSYPNGTPLDFNDDTIGVLRASGFQVAATTSPGILSGGADPMALPRVGLRDGASAWRRLAKTLAPSFSRIHAKERALRVGRSDRRVRKTSRPRDAG